MTQLFDHKAACFGCGACQAVCPADAIAMTADTEGFAYPVIDPEKCIDCGNCAAVCPAGHPLRGAAGEAYAVRCNDIELLKSSSSGGAFSLIAQQVLASDGLVCGAVFDEVFQVHHVLSDDIAPMRKSKYVQSDLQGAYRAMSKALANGKHVLFTGTPCQCDGLLHYFGEQPEGLILTALVCRGVQSPGLWADYVAHIARKGALEAYCFRDKRSRNGGHTVAYTVSGTERAVPMDKDAFARLYLKGLTLRPSCYQCPYTCRELPFDLTIGDYWGIEKTRPELADGMGTSLVIARTKAGRALLDAIKPHGLVLKTSWEAADQPALSSPAKESILRKLLFRDYAQKDTDGHCDIPLILKKYGG